MLESCAGYRDRLEALHDGELPVDEQLAVRAHVEHCASCAYELHGLEQLRTAFHDVPAVTGGRAVAPPDSFTGNLLEQVRVERQLSWYTWLAGVFDDMHLVWPALGATVAVLVCLMASAGVMQATAVQRPDSLAGVIDVLARPGSNLNPARIDEFTMVPRRHASSDWPLASEDAVLALSAVVTREGRIQRIEMLAAEQARALKVKPEVVLAMIEAASRAQFEPARAGGAPVAVSMVWLLAHTTVVGSPADVERLMRPLAPSTTTAMGPRPPRRLKTAVTLPVESTTSGAAGTTGAFAG
jgi:pimeloyl-ACP methyl ester carboxylesterase